MSRYLLPIAAVVMLIAFAAMQHHWLGAATRGERAHLLRLIQESRQNFSRAFDTQLTELVRDLTTQEEPGFEDSVIMGYELWRARTPWPEMVEEIQLISVRPTHGDQRSVQVFRPGDKAFRLLSPSGDDAANEPATEASPHSPQLGRPPSPHREEQAERSHGDHGDHEHSPERREPPQLHAGLRRRLSLRPQISYQPLTFTLPITQELFFAGGHISRRQPSHRLAIVLNEAYLKETVFPQLQKEFIPQEYRVMAADAETEAVVFDSAPEVRAPFDREHTVPMFSLRPIFDGDAPTEAPPRMTREELDRTYRGKARAIVNFQMLHFLVREDQNTGQGLWLLTTQHKQGTVGDVLAAAHMRNAGLAIGVFLTLVLSVWLIWRSAVRTQRLAHRQIDFVAGISHELMTPLAGIRSAAQNLAEGVVKDPDKVARYGDLINKEGARLTGMVEQVLAFAGVQSGRQEYDPVPLAASAFINETLDQTQHLLSQAGMQLIRQVPDDLPQIQADPRALERVFQNMVGNAVKYAAMGGEFTVSAAVEHAVLVLRFQDKGPGIDKGDLAQLFDPFYRGKRHVASNTPGSGLGLCIVRHIIEGHKGRVSVQNQNPGACFKVELPLSG